MRIGIMYSGVGGPNGADYVADYLANGFRDIGINPVMIGRFGGYQLEFGTQANRIMDRCDLIIHSSGFNLTPSEVTAIQHHAPLALWTHNDEISWWIDRIAPISKLCRWHYSYSKAHPYGDHVLYMPLAADTRSYYPIAGVEKKYDVALVGSKRRWRCAFTDELAKRFPRSCFSYAMSRPVEEINMIYNQSRVIVAPVQDCDEDQPGRAWGCPCRTFDVPASGAFQMHVERGGLKDAYPNAFVVTGPHDPLDVESASSLWGDYIEWALDTPALEEQANQDYAHTLAHHTYAHRAQQFLEALNG